MFSFKFSDIFTINWMKILFLFTFLLCVILLSGIHIPVFNKYFFVLIYVFVIKKPLIFSCLEVRSNQLPLFGHFCCRLAAQPNCISQPVLSGPLTLPLMSRPRPSWAQLQAFTLHFWQDREAWLKGAEPITSTVVDSVC